MILQSNVLLHLIDIAINFDDFIKSLTKFTIIGKREVVYKIVCIKEFLLMLTITLLTQSLF